jgi:circadian clock protein KaiB
MKKQRDVDRSKDFERAVAAASEQSERYVFRLYITGNTPKSGRAIENLRDLCEKHLRGRYDLEVIDICQQPSLASSEQIIAAPTLIKKLPEPLRKFVGDLSDSDRILLGVGLS